MSRRFDNASAWVGLPFQEGGRFRSGCDCWGLARLVYAGELGIELPSYANAYPSDGERSEVAALINNDAAAYPWRAVEAVRAFDLLLFRRGRDACHIGIVIEHGLLLHSAAPDQSKIAPYLGPRMRARLVGAYRHADMLEGCA